MRKLRVLATTLTVLALLLCASAAAFAQFSGGDDGDYQILAARYGTSERNIDVTARLKELARQDRTFRMGNSTFGTDPDPGRRKVLRIYARGRNGQTRMFEYVEGSTVDGSLFTGWGRGSWANDDWRGGWDAGDEGQFQILAARYGTPERNIDVTARLRELAAQDRTFRMGNSTFGTDPDPGRKKMLRIYARAANGQTRTFDYIESSTIDGSLFTGWGGGNWGREGWNGGWDANGGSDDGEYQILAARYGTSQRNIDVTERLRELAAQDRRFRMGNSTFGTDPDPGRLKTLRIYARGRNGQTRTFDYTEGSTVDGSQFTGWGGGNWGREGWNGGWEVSDNRGSNVAVLRIERATYGDGRRSRDVTGRLRSMARDGSIDVSVGNSSMGGDPAPGARKTLWISYTINGRTQEARLAEGDRLRLP